MIKKDEDGCGIIDSSLEPPRECVDMLELESLECNDWLSQLHRDVEVLEPKDDHKISLLNLLDRTTLKGSRQFLASVLGSTPLSDPSVIRARQAALKDLENKGLIDETSDKSNTSEEQRLRDLEADVLWFFRQKEDDTLSLLTDSVYFASWPLSILNHRSPLALSGIHAYNSWSPWVSVLSPVIYLVIPYLVLRWKGVVNFGFLRYLYLMVKSTVSQALCLGQEGVNLATRAGSALRGLSALLSTGVFFYSIVNSFELSRTFEKVGKTVADRIEGALEFLAIARKRRVRFIGPETSLCLWWDRLGHLGDSSHLGHPGHPGKERDFYLKRGEQLVDAKRFDHAAAAKDLSVSYALDALASILKSRKSLGFCWAEYSDEDLPSIDLKGIRHPFITSAVENDWVLGHRNSEGPNVLLTGPNAGGKSTLMKAVLSAVLLAQTLTIAPCKSCTLTPFSTIASHLSAVDRAGSASTFETEMLRAQKVLGHITEKDKGRTFVVLDEIFNSTNPVEGIAAATAVARRLGRSTSTLSIISTHYVHLGKLTGDRFSKYQMPIFWKKIDQNTVALKSVDQNTMALKSVDQNTVALKSVDVNTVASKSVDQKIDMSKTDKEIDDNPDMIIEYPYKLRKGVCRQLIALELMKKAGFDASVVDEALEISRSFYKSVG